MFISSKEARCVSFSVSVHEGVLTEAPLKYKADFGFILNDESSVIILFKHFIFPEEEEELDVFLSKFKDGLSFKNIQIDSVVNCVVNLILTRKDASFEVLGIDKTKRGKKS